jgi:hypothetical protein
VKVVIILAAVAAVGLGACHRKDAFVSNDVEQHGRYAGAGVYPASDGWYRLVAPEVPKDSKAARVKDDDEIIVVVDTKTGELRQCGNMSGYCIGVSPWAKPLPTTQQLPVAMDAHTIRLTVAPAPGAANAPEEAAPAN